MSLETTGYVLKTKTQFLNLPLTNRQCIKELEHLGNQKRRPHAWDVYT